MTTAQLSHLRAIDAHLAKLLAIAAKRTPGEWKQDYIYVDTSDKADLIKAEGSVGNAAFIASCAGNAEAGWKATRAAIASLLLVSRYDLDAMLLVKSFGNLADETLQRILAAFPLESLKL